MPMLGFLLKFSFISFQGLSHPERDSDETVYLSLPVDRRKLTWALGGVRPAAEGGAARAQVSGGLGQSSGPASPSSQEPSSSPTSSSSSPVGSWEGLLQ